MSEKSAKPEAGTSDSRIHPAARLFLWLDDPKVKAATVYVFGGLTIGLLVLEMIIPQFSAAKWEDALGVYEVEGFIGLFFAALIGWPLRRLLGRPDDYYDVEGDHD